MKRTFAIAMLAVASQSVKLGVQEETVVNVDLSADVKREAERDGGQGDIQWDVLQNVCVDNPGVCGKKGTRITSAVFDNMTGRRQTNIVVDKDKNLMINTQAIKVDRNSA